jgi:hypothetical protein
MLQEMITGAAKAVVADTVQEVADAIKSDTPVEAVAAVIDSKVATVQNTVEKVVVVSSVIQALGKGAIIANATLWKNRAIMVNIVSVVLSVLVMLLGNFGVQIAYDDEMVQAIVTGLIALGSLFNGAMLVATSAKVGIGPGIVKEAAQ